MIRVGLIGAGRWAEVHRDALKETGAALDAVLVSREESRRRVEKDWGVPATTDMQTFLSYGCSAVIVVSPNYLHAQHTVAALNAGKHVLVEKPFATTLEDAKDMLAAAERSNKLLANGLEMRVFTLFSTVKDLLDEGRLGKPLHLKLDLWRRPYRAGAGGWKTDPLKMGSSILEEPVHYLDLARWYLLPSAGEPAEVTAWANSRAGREILNENLDVRLSYKDGTQALITRSIAGFGHSVRLQIVGEKGSLRADWRGELDMDPKPEVRLELHTSGERDAPPEVIPMPQSGHAFDVPRQTKAFLEAIEKGGEPAASAEDGLASVALCLAVEEALERSNS